jgi:hypothetical protein
MDTEGAEAFSPLFDCSLPLAASDDDGGNQANIAASGASNQTERDARAGARQLALGIADDVLDDRGRRD